LLSSTIPLVRNDTEERQTTALEQAEKEAGCKKAVVIVACSHGGLCNAPSQNHRRHQYSVGDFDDENGGEGLPRELRNWSDRADEGVLVAFETSVFLQTEDRAISEDRLVENLGRRKSQSPSMEGYWQCV